MPSVNVQPVLLFPDTSDVLFPNLPQHGRRKSRERIVVAHFGEPSLDAAKVARFLEEPTVNERFNEIHERGPSCSCLAPPWCRSRIRMLPLKIVHQGCNLRRSTLDLDVQPLGSDNLSLRHIQVFNITVLRIPEYDKCRQEL